MKFYQEQTEWAGGGANHTYLLSEDKSKMYAYVKYSTKTVFEFKNPIGINVRGRKFKQVPNTFNYNIPQIQSNNPIWTVVGSKGNIYVIERIGAQYNCTCSGFQFRGKCSHIETIGKRNPQ
jgi:hypothetical protein